MKGRGYKVKLETERDETPFANAPTREEATDPFALAPHEVTARIAAATALAGALLAIARRYPSMRFDRMGVHIEERGFWSAERVEEALDVISGHMRHMADAQPAPRLRQRRRPRSAPRHAARRALRRHVHRHLEHHRRACARLSARRQVPHRARRLERDSIALRHAL
jgi:hypothetical protein